MRAQRQQEDIQRRMQELQQKLLAGGVVTPEEMNAAKSAPAAAAEVGGGGGGGGVECVSGLIRVGEEGWGRLPVAAAPAGDCCCTMRGACRSWFRAPCTLQEAASEEELARRLARSEAFRLMEEAQVR